MTMPTVLKWASNRKLVILLSITTLCFFVSTVALSHRNASLCVPYAEEEKGKILNYVAHKTALNATQEINYRLSRDVKPLNYTLKLWPDLVEKKFRGNIKIRMQILKPINILKLHSKDLRVIALNFNKNHRNIVINTTKHVTENDIFQLQFTQKIDEGIYELFMEFIGRLDKGIVGLYASSMKNGKYEFT